MFRSLYSDHGGYRRPVNSWNAADIRGEDELLQHGTVIDAERDGLVVDFGCDGRRRQLVRYGQAFGFWDIRYSVDQLQPGCAVEVLLRLDDKSPWVWRPATLVTADANWAYLSMVDAQLGGVGRRELVQYQQVRPPTSSVELQSRVLWRDVFEAGVIRPLPADIAALLPTHSPLWKLFCQHLSSHEHVSPISVNDSEMLVLYRKQSRFSRSEHPTPPGQLVVWRAQYSLRESKELGMIRMESGFRCSFTLPVSDGWLEIQETVGETGWTLARPIVAEIFSYLDTMQQANQRRVCRAFNDLLSSTMSVEIRLTYRECGMGNLAFCCKCSQLVHHYLITAPLLMCTSTRTRRITVTKAEPGVLIKVLDTLKTCRDLGLCDARQQMLVVAGQCDVGEGEIFWYNAKYLAKAMAGGWCKLLLKDCTMGRPLDVRFSGSLPEDLCHLIESQLPAIDVQKTSEWVASAVQGLLPGYDFIDMDLYEFVTADPRKDSYGTGAEWTEEELDALDFSKLSRVAQYALSRYLPSESDDDDSGTPYPSWVFSCDTAFLN